MNNAQENRPIGIFDSGLGGLSVLVEASKQLENEDFIYVGDSIHNPYGTRTKEEIGQYCRTICDWFKKQNVKAVVIACNTATSACVNELRNEYDFPIIGMEPALKVAADHEGNRDIAVWATELTLKEKKFQNLEHRFDKDHQIIEVPAPKLVRLVEEEKLFDPKPVRQALDEYLQNSKADESLDAIVLGCTHFVFFRDALKSHPLAPDMVVDGNKGTVRHLKNILEEKNLRSKKDSQQVLITNTDPSRIEWSVRLYKLTGGRNGQKAECVADIF